MGDFWEGRDDKPQEECGVFGIYARGSEVGRITYYALYALQHRGQESAGIAVANGEEINVHKGMGLVSEVFTDQIIDSFHGHIAIGHVRYSTTGASLAANAQPIVVHYQDGMIALAHNGNLTNAAELRAELGRTGAVFHTTVDTEAIINLIARNCRGSLEDSLNKTMIDLRGAYALVVMTEDKLLGARDPFGIRPLCIGKIDGGYCLASESCAFDTIGAEFVRDVEPGEIVTIDDEGLHSRKGIFETGKAICAFEYIYFARPDSTIDGINVLESRRNMGVQLAKESPIEADLVVPVPDSGRAAALGYAQALGIPFEEGFVKNRYVGRTFIKPSQEMREIGVHLKLNANRSILQGKKVVMIDDSIVRGTTSTRLIKMMKNAGAKEVHLLISSPPVLYPCYYGIDTAEREQLIATQLDKDGICKLVGADSLYYLSEEGLKEALQGEPCCMACFNGNYPTPVPAGNVNKFQLEAKGKRKSRC